MGDTAIVLNATLWKVTSDHDGEAKITFVVPLSDLDKAAQVAQMVDKLLSVTVEIQGG